MIEVFSPDMPQQAQQLQMRLNQVINTSEPIRLHLEQDVLQLELAGMNPMAVELANLDLAGRGIGKKQPLARACMVDKKPKLLDLSAGWGRDAAILAHLGVDVLMLERNPLMAALLENGISRLKQSVGANSVSLRFQHVDSVSYLEQLQPEDYPDVIYFDPMHPARRKSALVKKDMQVLQRLIGCDEDKQQVLSLALKRCTKRVVLKWPAKASPLMPELEPSVVYRQGKTIRFDVWFSLL